MSYIDNFEIQPKNDIVASLLSLELNKKISLDDKIQINSDTRENISSNEQYVLDCVKDGKITNFDENIFITKVKEDAIKNGLLKESKIEWRNLKKVLLLCISSIILLIFICIILFNDLINNPTNIADWKLATLAFAILLIVNLPISLAVYFYTYIVKTKNNNYIRTKKGEELNEKLEGLQNYLKDFSIMHERDEKSLTLWQDYLIYSVIFEQNTNIIKNIWDKYVII